MVVQKVGQNHQWEKHLAEFSQVPEEQVVCPFSISRRLPSTQVDVIWQAAGLRPLTVSNTCPLNSMLSSTDYTFVDLLNAHLRCSVSTYLQWFNSWCLYSRKSVGLSQMCACTQRVSQKVAQLQGLLEMLCKCTRSFDLVPCTIFFKCGSYTNSINIEIWSTLIQGGAAKESELALRPAQITWRRSVTQATCWATRCRYASGRQTERTPWERVRWLGLAYNAKPWRWGRALRKVRHWHHHHHHAIPLERLTI